MLKTIAILALSTVPASAMSCSPTLDNAAVLKNLQNDYDETVRFVGVAKPAGFPVEVTVSDKGTWTLVLRTPIGICIVAGGDSWQAVEPKPAGTEN